MIRRLVKEDRQKFIDLMECFVTERMGEFGLVFDRTMAGIQFDLFIADPNVKGLVIDDSGDLCGAIVGVFAPLLFCKGSAAQELVWYVRPDKRGSSGIKLIREFEAMATESKCSGLMMIGMSGDKSNYFYEKDGYRPLQNTYLKRISD